VVTEEEIEQFQDSGRKKVAAFEKAAVAPKIPNPASSEVDTDTENAEFDPDSAYGRLLSLQDASLELLKEAKDFEKLDSSCAVTERKLALDSLTAKAGELKSGLSELDACLTSQELADIELTEQIKAVEEVEAKQSHDNAEHLVKLIALNAEYAPKPRQIAAWTIHTRSHLNDEPVSGSLDFIKPEDKWTVDYSIDEVPAMQVDELYHACLNRKRTATITAKSAASQDQFYKSKFFRDLGAWSEKGAKWRKERELLDEEMGSPVVFESVTKKREGRVFAEGKGVASVDEYVDWLYEGGRK
jgi:hypothetical protein